MRDQDLSELYKIRFAAAELPRKNAIWKIICSKFIQNYVNKNDTVVDIACGYGEFLNNIDASRKIAIDLNPDSAKFLNENVEFHNLSADKLATVIDGKADVVFTSNFLEHLPNKEVFGKVLDGIYAALKPGGRYIILGPNLRYLPGEYWDFYDHHLGLTHLSLSEALQLKGFKIQKCVPKFLPYTTQGALPTHPFFVDLYLKFPLAWSILGKQFFIVAQK